MTWLTSGCESRKLSGNIYEKAIDVEAFNRRAGFGHNRARCCALGQTLRVFRDRSPIPIHPALEPPVITPKLYAAGCHSRMEMPEEGRAGAHQARQ